MSEDNFNLNENEIIENKENINLNNELMLPPSSWVYLTLTDCCSVQKKFDRKGYV